MYPTAVSENSSSEMIIIQTITEQCVQTYKCIEKDQITNVIPNEYILEYSAAASRKRCDSNTFHIDPMLSYVKLYL